MTKSYVFLPKCRGKRGLKRFAQKQPTIGARSPLEYNGYPQIVCSKARY
jgi:hypothetical protein